MTSDRILQLARELAHFPDAERLTPAAFLEMVDRVAAALERATQEEITRARRPRLRVVK